MTITTRPCIICGQTSQVEVEESKYQEWQAGKPIQDVLWDMTPGERELLMTGIHDKCWEKMFAE